MFETFKKLFAKTNAPTVNVTTAGDSNNSLPNGFFVSIGGGTRDFGFNCSKCGFSCRYGAKAGVQHCGKHEAFPAEPGVLPEVTWQLPAGPAVRAGNNTIVDTDNMPGTFNGEFEYEPLDGGSTVGGGVGFGWKNWS